MTLSRKYSVANALATAFKPLLGNRFSELPQHTQFGIVLNKAFITKGRTVTLNNLYEFDNASHIANLVLLRLNGGTFDDTIPEVEL